MNLKNLTFICLITSISISLSGCKNNSNNQQVISEDQVIQVESDDKDMNRAINKAKSTFNNFMKAFNENKYQDYTIKAKFKTNDNNYEHMWVNNLQVDNGHLVGTLANTPIGDMDIAYGDSVKINDTNISDWMYMDPKTNTIYGGYTMRVIYDRMSKKEKADFEEQIGGKFSAE